MPFIPCMRMRIENRKSNELAHRLEPLSQTLFSAHRIAEVLPGIWERNPAEGESRLNELRQLTFTALAEMDDLLDELWGMNPNRGDIFTRLSEEN